jgi:hypothetical protein
MKIDYDDPAIRIGIAGLAVGVAGLILGFISLMVALGLGAYLIVAMTSAAVGAATAALLLSRRKH